MSFRSRFHGQTPEASHIIRAGEAEWHVPTEYPVAFVYNRRNYAMMMASPTDAADFAVGFSLTERIITDMSELSSLDVYQSERGIDLRVRLTPTAFERFEQIEEQRALIGHSGCGLCGLETADRIFKPLPEVATQPLDISPSLISNAMAALKPIQVLGTLTRTTHAAAWVDLSGHIIVVREDVGRHTALDKLIGALAISDTSAETGFVLMSSRCSYEIIEKSAQFGIRALASLSAPTSLALHKARGANMAIYTRASQGVVRLI